jgi:hypothetical protein
MVDEMAAVSMINQSNADVRNELLSAFSNLNTTQFFQKSSLLNTKKEVLLETAGALLSGMENKVSPAIIVALAFEESTDNKFVEARQHYELALQLPAVDVITKIACRRSLGELYMQPRSPFYSLDLGRKQFRDALATLDGQEDDFAFYYRAFILSDQASFEFINAKPREASASLEEARAASLKVATVSPLRQQAASLVLMAEQYIQNSAPNRTDEFDGRLLSHFDGRWRVRYQDDPGLSGFLIVMASSDGKTGNGNLGVFRSGQLIKNILDNFTSVRQGRSKWSGRVLKRSPRPERRGCRYSVLQVSRGCRRMSLEANSV